MSIVLTFTVPPGKPVLRGHDHFWSVILDLDQAGPWGAPDILGRCNGVHRATITKFVQRLVAARYAEQVEAGQRLRYRLLRWQPTAPRLRRDGSPVAQGRGQIQMWNLLRGPMGRQGVTVPDLAAFASTAAVRIERATARRYISHLNRAGYLNTLRPGSSGQPAVYALRPGMNTGREPPLILRGDVVYDQNRKAAVGPVEAREVAP